MGKKVVGKVKSWGHFAVFVELLHPLRKLTLPRFVLRWQNICSQSGLDKRPGYNFN